MVEQRTVEQPLDTVREIQSKYKISEYPGLPEMIGGLVGYFGYETVSYIESRLADQDKPDELGTPDIMLMLSLNVLIFDNLAGTIYMMSLADINDSNAYQKAQQQLDKCDAQLSANLELPKLTFANTSDGKHKKIIDEDYELHFDQSDFQNAVERCQDYIRDGDIMQVVLSQRLSKAYDGPPINVYRALRLINPSPHMYLSLIHI